MGHVNVQITLKNAWDVTSAQCGVISEPEVRQVTVDAMVDTGATMLVINREIFNKLGLGVIDERRVSFANNANVICKMTNAVEIHWENRFFPMSAMLVEDAPEILLGVIPLEGMDLMVDPVRQKLVAAHGDIPTCLCY